jgi:hypothetical protein
MENHLKSAGCLLETIPTDSTYGFIQGTLRQFVQRNGMRKSARVMALHKI